jgi:competence ComEA-like helix-hairpin-helix protein
MERSRKFLSVVCFIGLLCFIFSILILAPKITFAEVSEKVKSEVSEKVVAEEKINININTATQEELAQLKGIGANLAQRVIEYRDQHGPFEKIEDILKVKGLGEKFLEENNDRISVGKEVKEEAKKDVEVKE